MSRLTPTQGRVFKALWMLTRDDRWPAHMNDLTGATQLGRSSVHRAIGQLIEKGLVEKHPRSHTGGWRVTREETE